MAYLGAEELTTSNLFKNEYTLGTLAGNWQEDRMALELKKLSKGAPETREPAVTEMQDAFKPGKVAQRVDISVSEGLPGHLIFGHGANLRQRSFGTTQGDSYHWPVREGELPPIVDRSVRSRALHSLTAAERSAQQSAAAMSEAVAGTRADQTRRTRPQAGSTSISLGDDNPQERVRGDIRVCLCIYSLSVYLVSVLHTMPQPRTPHPSS